jgi:hypothetical protein
VQSAISFDVREPAEAYTVKDDPSTQTLNAPQAVVDEPQIEAAPVTHHPPAEKLMHTVREILLSELEDARAEDDIAELLNVSAAQAKAWLKQLVSEGLLTRHTKPVRYSVSKPADRLL